MSFIYEERCRAASELRKAERHMGVYAFGQHVARAVDPEDETETWDAVCSRLADLVEPDEGQKPPDVSGNPACGTRGGREAACVTIPPVRAFAGIAPDKAQALKPLEEAAEVFGAWQLWDEHPDGDLGERLASDLVDECADVIQATCNLLAAMGVTDLSEAMAACERRNRERGRYGDR